MATDGPFPHQRYRESSPLCIRERSAEEVREEER